MSTDPYEDILNQAKGLLSPQQQQRLVEELAQHAARKNGESHSIMELKGLGKEIWKGIDADEYVAKERDSWGG